MSAVRQPAKAMLSVPCGTGDMKGAEVGACSNLLRAQVLLSMLRLLAELMGALQGHRGHGGSYERNRGHGGGNRGIPPPRMPPPLPRGMPVDRGMPGESHVRAADGLKVP